MFRLALAVGTVAIALFLVDRGLTGDDKKGTETPKAKGKLPLYWSKLGLSDAQKKQAYSTLANYKSKIDQLKDQIEQLQKQEKTDLLKILTDDQRDQLRRMIEDKVLPKDAAPKDKDKEKDKKTEPKDK
jgi:hypothetical protein